MLTLTKVRVVVMTETKLLIAAFVLSFLFPFAIFKFSEQILHTYYNQ